MLLCVSANHPAYLENQSNEHHANELQVAVCIDTIVFRLASPECICVLLCRLAEFGDQIN